VGVVVGVGAPDTPVTGTVGVVTTGGVGTATRMTGGERTGGGGAATFFTKTTFFLGTTTCFLGTTTAEPTRECRQYGPNTTFFWGTTTCLGVQTPAGDVVSMRTPGRWTKRKNP
jgi:hypothetical protein